MQCVIFWSPPGSEPCGSCDYHYPVEYESKEKLENDFLGIALKMREEWDAYDVAHAIWREKDQALSIKRDKARKAGTVADLDAEWDELHKQRPSEPARELKICGEEFSYHDLFYRDSWSNDREKVHENMPEFYTLQEWFDNFRTNKD